MVFPLLAAFSLTMLSLIQSTLLVKGFLTYRAVSLLQSQVIRSQRHVFFKQQTLFRCTSDGTTTTTTTNFSSSSCPESKAPSASQSSSTMENALQSWTLEQDQVLWKYYYSTQQSAETIPQLAVRLGRGLRGTQERIQRLGNVNSPAYQRLFPTLCGEDDTRNFLVPAFSILRRIEYDPQLDASEYLVRYYDRVENTLLDRPMMAPNTSIDGPQRKWIGALPEHRIMAILYKERVVWDRETKLDLVSDKSMLEIQSKYEQWKQDKDAKQVRQREQQQAIVQEIKDTLLGQDGYDTFVQVTQELLADTLLLPPDRETTTATTKKRKKKAVVVSTKRQVETYVEQAVSLFRNHSQQPVDRNDALEALSQLLAIHSPINESVRTLVLDELHVQLQTTKGAVKDKQPQSLLPDLREDDLEETFIRGSGPGGQKVNKTSNRVVLVHTPTRLRVECQDTRSLPQNRKIARKRLRLLLDTFLRGKESQTEQKSQKAATKKQKAKARSRARVRKKQLAKKEQQEEIEEEH